MRIRRALTEDAFALAKLHLETWQFAYHGILSDEYLNSLNLKTKAARFVRHLDAEYERDIHTFVAEKSGRICGFITFGACRDGDVSPDSASEVYAIYVAPKHWRLGIGLMLLRYVEAQMTGAGFRRSYIWVLADNLNACKFYEAVAYSLDGASRFSEFGEPVQCIRYQKNLSQASVTETER